MWIVYILLCDSQTFYVGITTDLRNRISQQKSKQSFYTKRFKKIALVYTEEYRFQKDAEKREQQIKRWSRAKKRALTESDRETLVSLSKSLLNR